MSWYKIKTASKDVYYSPFTSFKNEYYVIGEGEELPKPADIIEEFNKKDKTVTYDHRIGVFSKQTKGMAGDPVDLPNGVFEFEDVNGGRLREIQIRKERYIEIGGAAGSIIKSIENFIAKEEVYRKSEMIYKLGILMYGQPGQSKTATIRHILNSVALDNAVVIFMPSLPKPNFLTKMQQTLNDRLKIVIFEELTEAFHQSRQSMDQVLNFLDGEASLDKSIMLATTNYPEDLPHNIVDRPSRFDKVIFVAPPDAAGRAALIKGFLGTDPTADEIKSTEGMSVAVIKEICLQVKIEGSTFSDAVSSMKARSKICKDQFKASRGKNDVGFSL